ncbi:MAG: hypothetical protein Kow00127_10350 [Bacteroidales bacterium]
MNKTEKPVLQAFHIEGVKHILPEEAFRLLEEKEAILIDVREKYEVVMEYLPMDRVLNHPLSVIMERLNFIPKDQKIVVACPGGVRSTKVANMLNHQGYPDVFNLDGGFDAWITRGLPWEGTRVDSGGCGCGCNTSSPGNNSCC